MLIETGLIETSVERKKKSGKGKGEKETGNLGKIGNMEQRTEIEEMDL